MRYVLRETKRVTLFLFHIIVTGVVAEWPKYEGTLSIKEKNNLG